MLRRKVLFVVCLLTAAYAERIIYYTIHSEEKVNNATGVNNSVGVGAVNSPGVNNSGMNNPGW